VTGGWWGHPATGRRMQSLLAAVFLPPGTSEAVDPTTPLVMYNSVRVLHAALTAAGRLGRVPFLVLQCAQQRSPDFASLANEIQVGNSSQNAVCCVAYVLPAPVLCTVCQAGRRGVFVSMWMHDAWGLCECTACGTAHATSISNITATCW
jgi:hypothetical protein